MSALARLNAEQIARLADPVGAALFALLAELQRELVLADVADFAPRMADECPRLGPDARESVEHLREVLVSYVHNGRDPLGPRRQYGATTVARVATQRLVVEVVTAARAGAGAS